MIFRQRKEVNTYLSDTFKRTIYKPSLLIFQEEKVVGVCSCLYGNVLHIDPHRAFSLDGFCQTPK